MPWTVRPPLAPPPSVAASMRRFQGFLTRHGRSAPWHGFDAVVDRVRMQVLQQRQPLGYRLVRKITPAGVVSTVVGQFGQYGLKEGALPGALPSMAYGLAVSGDALVITTGTGVMRVAPLQRVSFEIEACVAPAEVAELRRVLDDWLRAAHEANGGELARVGAARLTGHIGAVAQAGLLAIGAQRADLARPAHAPLAAARCVSGQRVALGDRVAQRPRHHEIGRAHV